MQKISLFLILQCFIVVFAVDENALFPYLPNIVNYSANDLCKTENKIYETNLENLTMWAYEMLDASTKNSFSILQGSNTHLGSWEECINVDGPFMTQYCLVALRANVSINSSRDPFSLYYGPYESVLEKFRKSDDISKRSRNVVNLGVCLPASCSLDDITNSFNHYLKGVKTSMTHANVTYSVAIDRNLCQTRDSARKLDGWDISFCILCLGLTVIVTFSTLYDFYQPTTKKFKNQSILKIFSARNNCIGLFKSDDAQSDLRILNGLKSIAMCAVIFGHRGILMALQPAINFDFIEEFTASPFSAPNLNSGLFVDTFFTITGLLLSYSWLNNLDKIKNPLQIIFLRFIRLTPSYAFIVFYGATLYYFSGSGPMWNKFILPESEDCRENWWKNLLYISNYVDTESTCMPILWYISCDLHLYIMGVIIMMVLSKSKRHGYILISFLLIISFAAPFGQLLYYGISPIIEYFPEIIDQLKTNQTFNLVYIKTHNRAGIYLLGMIGGIIYHNFTTETKTLSRVKSYLIACGFLLVKVGCLYSAALFYNRNLKIGKVTSAIYFPIVHALWAVAVIGLFLSATLGPPNLIKSILSWPTFTPISKLAYGIYLVHFPLQFITFSSAKTYRHISISELIYVYIADLVLAMFFAFILHIAVEAPVKNVCKLIFRRRHSERIITSEEPNRQNIQASA